MSEPRGRDAPGSGSATERADGTDPDVSTGDTQASGELGPSDTPVAPAGLGRFAVERELGRGGMGRVLEARDPDLGRRVAVKVLLGGAGATPPQLARFLTEAQVTGQLEHPNIVPVYELGRTEAGEVYIVLKRVSGRSLRDVLRGLRSGDADPREWSRHRLLSVFVQVCNAVAYAHERGVLHRDLKPDNVMLGEFGEVLVMDWGVARAASSSSPVAPAPPAPFSPAAPEADTDRHHPVPTPRTGSSPGRISPSSPSYTQEGVLVGTPGYMSPEQASGMVAELDGRSDVWSLGAILHEILVGQPPFSETKPRALLALAFAEPPDPRARSFDRRIPDEIAEVCLQAMAPDRARRIASAASLAAAVQAFLEGSRRRDQALGRVAQARTAWQEYVALGAVHEQLSAREKRLAERTPPWTPLAEKAELLAARADLAELEPRRARVFGDVVAHCEKALSHEPDNADARAVLAEAYWEKLEDAERRRDRAGASYYAERVRAHDDGHWAARLDGAGTLTLRTSPPGALVFCRRFERRGLVWPLVEDRILGVTPLEDVPLAMGSYLLTLKLPGRSDTLYPVYIPRCRKWTSGPDPVPLHTDAQIGAGFAYVPPGPFVCGGDPQAPRSLPLSEPELPGFFLSVFPATMADYAEFLSALHARDPEQAWRRSPRAETGLRDARHQYFERPRADGRYRVPEKDRDGDPWDPRWPAFGISWLDCMAYVEWLSAHTGVPHALPTELEWEKAARGVDGRWFPWGDELDPSLCKMRDSRAGVPAPEPVGAFPADVSVYGVRDLAGSKREFCGDPSFDGDGEQRPLRGGSGVADAQGCRAAYRGSHALDKGNTNFSFRVVRRVPLRG
jgi:serine/threonine-protein kinase